MKIALVTFKGTHAAKVAAHITSYDVFEIGSSQRLIQTFLDSHTLDVYDFIVGMGLFTRPSDHVRVEACCFSDGKEYDLTTVLADGDYFRKSRSIGGSWCNLFAFRATANFPTKMVGFLHISSRLPVEQTAKQLTRQLQKLAPD